MSLMMRAIAVITELGNLKEKFGKIANFLKNL